MDRISMPPAEPREEYAQRLEARRGSLATCVGRYKILGNLRAVAFLAAVAIVFASFRFETLSAWWLLVPAALFLWLTLLLQSARNERANLSRAVVFYERGLARLDGRWAGSGETGDRFLD